jgi:uncharacterized membrane protein
VKRIRWFTAAFAAGAVAWALAIPLAAVVVANRLDAGVSRVAASAIYVAGSVVCHQKPERSFRLAGQPLPVCARCTGIYIGAALAVVALAGWTAGVRRNRASVMDAPRVRRIGLVALAPTLATLAWEWTIGTTPSNAVRAAAGLPIGAVVAWIVWRSARSHGQSR